MISRRTFVAGLAAGISAPALAQHAQHDPLFSHLRNPGLHPMPPEAEGQRFTHSSAPAAANPSK